MAEQILIKDKWFPDNNAIDRRFDTPSYTSLWFVGISLVVLVVIVRLFFKLRRGKSELE